MEKKRTHTTFGLVIWISLVLPASSLAQRVSSGQRIRVSDDLEYRIMPFVDNKTVILRNGVEHMRLDLTPYRYSNASVLPTYNRIIAGSSFPISPDHRYLPLIHRKSALRQPTLWYVILIDVLEKQIIATEISNSRSGEHASNLHFYRVDTVEWITNDKFVIHTHLTEYVYDINNPAKRGPLYHEYGMSWSGAKEHYASIYGKAGFLERGWRTFSINKPTFLSERSSYGRLSEAVKYNSRFVYPEAVQPYPGDYDHPDMIALGRSERVEDRIVFHDYVKDPPKIRAEGAVLDRRHVFSAPAFVADSTWMACFEQVYPLHPLGPFDEVECNILLIDAHAVDSVPPAPGSVKIVKVPVTPLIPKNEREYKDMTIYLTTHWNAEENAIEIWQGREPPGYARFSSIQPELIYSVPIDFVGAGPDRTPVPGAPRFMLAGREYAPIIPPDYSDAPMR